MVTRLYVQNKRGERVREAYLQTVDLVIKPRTTITVTVLNWMVKCHQWDTLEILISQTHNCREGG